MISASISMGHPLLARRHLGVEGRQPVSHRPNHSSARVQKGGASVAHYFTREEAEALLPAISAVLRTIQACRKDILQAEVELDKLLVQARGNGYHLHERMIKLQTDLTHHTQTLRRLIHKGHSFG